MLTANRTSPAEEDLRIVLLGRVGAGKSKVARFLFGSKEPKGEIGSCIIRDGETAGRRIYLVDTPGWNNRSIYNTPEKIKNEMIRSVSLCPPGPHALIVVLRVESLTDVPSTKELKTVSRHMELLSERAWKHTMLLFLCDKEIENHPIDEHIQNANRLLEKCGNRHFVLRSEAQVPKFLKEIEKMVEGNCGDFFLPQIYYDYMQSRIPHNVTEMKLMYEEREEELKKKYQKRLQQATEESEQKALVRKRSGSFQRLPPQMNEDDQNKYVEAVVHKLQEQILAQVKHYLKPVVLVLLMTIMIVFCALLGSVSGAVYGVLGAWVGIVIGAALAVPLTLWFINAARVAKDNTDHLHPQKTNY